MGKRTILEYSKLRTSGSAPRLPIKITLFKVPDMGANIKYAVHLVIVVSSALTPLKREPEMVSLHAYLLESIERQGNLQLKQTP